MMGIEYIRQINEERGTEAKYLGLEPVVLDVDSPFLNEDIRSIPHLGNYVPDGWELEKSHFVDATGWGSPDEPAMTFDQFRTQIRMEDANADEPIGFAIIEAGQFQIYIGQFKAL